MVVRILHMIGSLNIGGSQTMIMNIYRMIDRNRIQFDFIVDHSEQLYFKEEIEKLGGRVFVMPRFNGKNIFQVQEAWNCFFDAHPEYHVLHSHVRSYASIYFPIAKKHGIKTIVHSHSTSNGSGIKSVVKIILQYPLRYEADCFFGCSLKAGEWLFGKRIVQSDRYFTIKNAIDTQKYLFNRKQRSILRNQLRIEADATVFIHVGRLHEAKNHIFLLYVFAMLIKEMPNSMLLLVGDGELSSEIQKQIEQLNLQSNVKMLGARTDIPDMLNMADVFLFPSKWEGLPVTVVEAQASGLPCFVSDKITKEVGISELVRFLPIDKGAQVWIDAIKETDLTRKNVIDKIIQAGFDITESVEWLTKFYEEINE